MPGPFNVILASSGAMTVDFFVLEYYNLRLQGDPVLWNWYGCSYCVADRVAARSKEWICGRSRAGIVGSNSAAGLVFCPL